MDSQEHTSFCHCPTLAYRKKEEQQKTKDGWPGVHQLLLPPHLGLKKDGQQRAYQFLLLSKVGEQKRWLKRTDGQPRAHQLLLLSQVGVKRKQKTKRWLPRDTLTPATTPIGYTRRD